MFAEMRSESPRDEQSTPEKSQESQYRDSTSQTGPSQVWRVDTGETTSSDPGTLSEYQSRAAISADYRRWREIALKDIKAGKPIRTFASDVIPPDEYHHIAQALERCTTADEVRAIFKDAQEREASFLSVGGQLQNTAIPTKNSLIWRSVSVPDSRRS